MKKTIYFLCLAGLLGFIAILNTSCSEKTRAINDLEELAEDVQENGNTYGISEWTDIFGQYQTITKVIDKHRGDYSQKQRNRINHAKATIRQAAWDALSSKLDLVPGLKQRILDIFGNKEDNDSCKEN